MTPHNLACTSYYVVTQGACLASGGALEARHVPRFLRVVQSEGREPQSTGRIVPVELVASTQSAHRCDHRAVRCREMRGNGRGMHHTSRTAGERDD